MVEPYLLALPPKKSITTTQDGTLITKSKQLKSTEVDLCMELYLESKFGADGSTKRVEISTRFFSGRCRAWLGLGGGVHGQMLGLVERFLSHKNKLILIISGKLRLPTLQRDDPHDQRQKQ